jgi:hypothetical protein
MVAVVLITLAGCQQTFAGTLFFLTPRDIVAFVAFALGFGVIAAVIGNEPRTNFWFCFILSLVLTPIAGLIYVLILLTKK